MAQGGQRRLKVGRNLNSHSFRGPAGVGTEGGEQLISQPRWLKGWKLQRVYISRLADAGSGLSAPPVASPLQRGCPTWVGAGLVRGAVRDPAEGALFAGGPHMGVSAASVSSHAQAGGACASQGMASVTQSTGHKGFIRG